MRWEEAAHRRGDIVTAAWLGANGVTRSAIAAAVARGDLQRIRRGWFATRDAHPDLVRAARVGGAVSCVSALRLRGVWSIDDRRLHVRASRGDTVLRSADVRVHWSDARRGATVLDPPETALELALGCLDLPHSVALADSVANTRLLSEGTLVRLLGATPRGRRVLARFDPTAESGLETFARLALRSRGIRYRTQVVIVGVGRVDILIGERLVLELDGAQWHTGIDAVERDRTRDRELVARGYLVLRVTYRQLFEHGDDVEGQILRIVRRREHRRPPAEA